MPTTRPRHMLTETDELARALDLAQRKWPEVRNRRTLLRRLIEEGEKAMRDDEEASLRERRETIRRYSGALTGMYPPGYLDDVRGGDPE